MWLQVDKTAALAAHDAMGFGSKGRIGCESVTLVAEQVAEAVHAFTDSHLIRYWLLLFIKEVEFVRALRRTPLSSARYVATRIATGSFLTFRIRIEVIFL